MDSQLSTRATVLYVLATIGFALSFVAVLGNFFFSGVAIVLAILSGVLLIAALITSTALVVLRSFLRVAEAEDRAAGVSASSSGPDLGQSTPDSAATANRLLPPQWGDLERRPRGAP